VEGCIDGQWSSCGQASGMVVDGEWKRYIGGQWSSCGQASGMVVDR